MLAGHPVAHLPKFGVWAAPTLGQLLPAMTRATARPPAMPVSEGIRSSLQLETANRKGQDSSECRSSFRYSWSRFDYSGTLRMPALVRRLSRLADVRCGLGRRAPLAPDQAFRFVQEDGRPDWATPCSSAGACRSRSRGAKRDRCLTSRDVALL